MSGIQFYHFGPSPPCRSAHMTAKALGVSLDMKSMDFYKKDHLAPDFLKLNPEHTAPTIVDGDFILWESRAIMRYLVNRYGGNNNSLYPSDPKKRAIIDRYLDADLGTFYRSILENLIFPFRDKMDVTKEMEEKVIKAFDWLETQTKGKKFLAGNDVTLADLSIVVGFAGHILYKDGMAKYPNSMDWFRRMKNLPYYKECNQAFEDLIEKMRADRSQKA